MRKILIPCALALLSSSMMAREEGVSTATGGVADRARIEMHVGIPDVLYLGQSLDAVRARFSEIEVTRFAGDDKVGMVRIDEMGASCLIAGESADAMRIISVGFNFDGTYEGVGETEYRTKEGIGKGSTVNDLLGTYGRAEITDSTPQSPLRGRTPNEARDPNEPKKYLFANDDGSVKTYFESQGSLVARMVINHLPLIDRYILKRGAAR